MTDERARDPGQYLGHEPELAAGDDDTGRPTGPTDRDGLRAGQDQTDAPTESPEEQGGTPATEHAPGGDL
jgi:hypothetical protein